MRVLVAENRIFTEQLISAAFKAADLIVDHSDLGEKAFEMARYNFYDIVVVSMKLPDMDGLDLVRRIRSSRLDVPILMLTENDTMRKRTMAFTIGADDVVAKPVDHHELLARLNAIVRRIKGFSVSVISIGSLRVNQDAREATVDGIRLPLTSREYKILELLVIRAGQIVTKDTFLNHLYCGMHEPEMKIIDAFICKLRKKLFTTGVDVAINTIRRRGYILQEKNMPFVSHRRGRRISLQN